MAAEPSFAARGLRKTVAFVVAVAILAGVVAFLTRQEREEGAAAALAAGESHPRVVEQVPEPPRYQAPEERMDYPQRYAAAFTQGMFQSGVCGNLAQMILRIGNSKSLPENIRVMQMESLMHSAEQARCVPG